MARTTFVKKAQRRYVMVPVIDPETGQQVTTPVVGRNGEQKMTKSGKPVFMRQTVADKSQPLPNLVCDKCRQEITVGSPYKHISPKSGPYGGRKLVRCGTCPMWNVWEYSSSLGARIAEVQHGFDVSGAESEEEVRDALTEFADAVREIAAEKQESAENMEEGFGHPTSMSEELTEIAESLESWADEVEYADVPELPEPENEGCDECEGSGSIDCDQCQGQGVFHDGDDANTGTCEGCAGEGQVTCDECSGSGEIEGESPTDEQMDEWRSEVEDACSITEECPV
jgi:hypothetical protein